MTTGPRVAAIDCGTNSTRLLIGHRGDDGRLVTEQRLMRITRLGRGTGAAGVLAPDSVARTLAVIDEYRAVIREVGDVDRIRITATSAARDARNRADLFDPIEATFGVAPELLSGTEEAALSFLGATSDLDPALGPFLVVDIGGGSTEFAYGSSELEGAMSCDVGCVRLTEQYLLHDPPGPDELVQALSIAELHVDDVLREIEGAGTAATFVGLAGTVSTAAAVEIGLAQYDRERIHHFRLTKAAAEDVFRTLATEAFDDRIHNPGLEKERADVIVGGMCVLVTIMRRIGFDECLVSEADILDGLALSLL